MTSMSHKALKVVQKALPHLRLCKDVLVLPPTEHILRGYAFERRPYKETFYLWRVVLPLYRFNSRLILNYSHRIPKGDYVRLSKDAPDQSAVEVTRIVSDDLPKLEVIRDPRDFLDYVGWMIGNDTPGFMLDLAVTNFLIGRYPEAVLTLSEIPAAVDNNISLYERGSEGFEHFSNMRQIVMQLAQDIRVNSAAATKTISDWERKNIAEFQLAEAIKS